MQQRITNKPTSADMNASQLLHRHGSRGRFRWSLTALLLGLVSAIATHAATYTWTGSGPGGKWSTPDNWQGGVAPQAGETGVALLFPNSAAPRLTTNDVSNLGVVSIAFLAPDYQIHGRTTGTTLTLVNPNGSFAIVGGNNCRIGPTSPLHLGSSGTIAVGLGSTFTIGGKISGTGGFTKSSPGTLELEGSLPNTYSGPTLVLDGILHLDRFANPGDPVAVAIPGPLTIGDGNPAYTPRVRLGKGGQIGDTSAIRVNANGALWLSTMSDVVGSLTLAGGIVTTGQGGGDLYPGTLTLNGGVTNLPSGANPGRIHGLLSLGILNRYFDVAPGTELFVSAQISGGSFGNAYAGVVKNGLGRLTLAGTNTYDGYTAVMEGSVRLTSAGTPGSTNRPTTIGDGARLVLDTASVGNESLILYGAASTNIFVEWSGSNVWTGPIEVNGQCVLTGPAGSLLDHGGELRGPGSLRKIGAGTLRMSGDVASPFSGTLEVDSGVVSLAKSYPAYAVTNRLSIGRADGDLAGFGTATVIWEGNGPLLSDTVVTAHFGGTLNLNGFKQVIGNLVLAGGQIETGSGKLTIGHSITNLPGGLGSVINGHLDVASQYIAPTIFHSETNSSLTINAEIGTYDSNGPSKDGTLQKTGPGRLVFTSKNAFTHRMRVLDGEMELQERGDFGAFNIDAPTIEATGVLVLNNVSNHYMKVQLLVEPGRDAVHYRGTNYYHSFFSLGVNTNTFRAVPRLFETNAHLTIGFVINNVHPNGLAGTLVFDGPGTIEMADVPGYNSSFNWYKGRTWIKQGALLLNRANGTNAIPTELTIGQDSGPSAIVRLHSNEQIAASVRVLPTGLLDLNGHEETVDFLNANGNVRLADGELAVSGGTVDGYIYGSGGRLTKQGAGTLTLTANNGYTGRTLVKGGRLMVNGIQPQSRVDIENGGVIAGNGRVGTINSVLGLITPGASVGILKCAGYSTNALLSTLSFEIAGPIPGTGHDQLDVLGPVALANTALNVSLSSVGAVSNQYVIIQNDGIDAVAGTFTGLAEGAELTASGVKFRITYAGGDGNDVVLTQLGVAPSPQLGGVQRLADGSIQITATGQPNLAYRVEATSSLTPPIQWTDLGPATANGIGIATFTDGDAKGFPTRFYRFTAP